MRPVVIAGPTASGKSALALAIAERDGGWVINADALQVYACWRVLTARPAEADLARVPHRLYGHVDCRTRHSVGAWLREVAGALEDARACGARPVIVGGTGLYLGALTSGLAEISPVPAEVRSRSAALLRTGGLEALLADLRREDPATLARIDRSNPMRVRRAWEVRRATGRGLAEWQDAPAPPLLPADQAVRVSLSLDTARLNQLIT
jgi:tRNA dimethylallyltransferase